MFSIDYIKVSQDCHERIRKNLRVGYEYRFAETLEPNFFARNISVHAIVGKNGSGKSTLLEILFRLANNLSLALMSEVPRDAADNPCYFFGLFAEMGWHENNRGEKLEKTVSAYEDLKAKYDKLEGELAMRKRVYGRALAASVVRRVARWLRHGSILAAPSVISPQGRDKREVAETDDFTWVLVSRDGGFVFFMPCSRLRT